MPGSDGRGVSGRGVADTCWIMGRPQQPELNRSGNTPLQPDSIESELEARKQKRPGEGDDAGGPVPEENRPGHHPDRDQDKPDPDDFVEQFGGGASGRPSDRDPNGQDAAPPVDHLLRELGDRIRRRDPVLIATYPIHAAVELLRYGRDRVLALR